MLLSCLILVVKNDQSNLSPAYKLRLNSQHVTDLSSKLIENIYDRSFQKYKTIKYSFVVITIIVGFKIFYFRTCSLAGFIKWVKKIETYPQLHL